MAPKVELRRSTTIRPPRNRNSRSSLACPENRGTLSAPRDVLHDALYGALIESRKRLAAASGRCWRGELPLERVQEAAQEVLALDALLRGLDELS